MKATISLALSFAVINVYSSRHGIAITFNFRLARFDSIIYVDRFSRHLYLVHSFTKDLVRYTSPRSVLDIHSLGILHCSTLSHSDLADSTTHRAIRHNFPYS